VEVRPWIPQPLWREPRAAVDSAAADEGAMHHHGSHGGEAVDPATAVEGAQRRRGGSPVPPSK